MAKENIYQHNIRLNLDNPKHLELHNKLMNVDTDMYGSKNNYIIVKLTESIARDEGNLEIPEESARKIENRVTKRVLYQVLQILLSRFIGNGITIQQLIQEEPKSAEEDEFDENLFDAACGYFEG